MYRLIQSAEDLKSVFPLMKQLREHLDETQFVDLVQSAMRDSRYQLLGFFEDGNCQGLMGYRILTDLVHGRHMYIDDLVVDEKTRSKGLGARLLSKAKEIARSENCKRLRLCTGADNNRGKDFYERNGWKMRAVVYKTEP
jgi:ribosomal protein S18 acetylase RimI-like enzyme